MAIYPDISHYKPVQDWKKVKENCPFLITKATQGTSFIDSTLNSFIKGCEENKIPYWLYVYLNKGNELAQTKYMVEVCKPKVGTYFIGYILDVQAGNSASGVKQALDWLNQQGTKTMIYTMYSQYSTYSSVIAARGENCAAWEARYGANNGYYSSAYPCHSGMDLHQYTSNGSCPGLPKNVDLNRICGSKNEAWFTTKLAKKEEKKEQKKTKAKIVQEPGSAKNNLNLLYCAHNRDVGTSAWVRDGQTAGIIGKDKPLECFWINTTELKKQEGFENLKIDVLVHIQDVGDHTCVNVKPDTKLGTMGKVKHLEGIELQCTGLPEGKKLKFQVCSKGEWSTVGIANQVGSFRGSTGLCKPIEAIRIWIGE